MSAQRLSTDARIDRRTPDQPTPTLANRPATARVPFTFRYADSERLRNLVEEGNAVISVVDPASVEGA